MKYRLVIPEDGLTKEEIIQMAHNEKSIMYLYNAYIKEEIYNVSENQLRGFPDRCFVKINPKTHDEILDQELSMFERHENMHFGLTRNTLLKLMQLAVENEKLKIE